MLDRPVRTLKSGHQEYGLNETIWDGKDEYGMPCGSGMYVAWMRAREFTSMRKMLLVR